MPLFEVTVIGVKHFYVEAATQEEALESDVVDNETSASFGGDIDWEVDEWSANPVSAAEEATVRRMRPKKILKDDPADGVAPAQDDAEG